jgi:ribosomal protein S18 acetylase RimI-like enzyme
MFNFHFDHFHHIAPEKLTSNQPTNETNLDQIISVRKFPGYKMVEYLAGLVDCSVSIRRICSKDIADLVAIERQISSSPWQKEDFQRKINMGSPYYCFLSADQNKIQSYVIFEVKDNNIDILRLVVAPEFRRQGIATGVLAEVSKKYPLQKCKTISVLIEEDNVEAKSFLTAVGFNQFGSLKNSPSQEILHLYSDDFSNFTSLYKNQANIIINELFYQNVEIKNIFTMFREKIGMLFNYLLDRFRYYRH